MIDITIGGRFRLGDAIGSGSYSTVYAAIDEWTATPVAVKVLRGGEDHLLAEASLLSTVRHPNVVGYYDSGRETVGPLAGRIWVAMERADQTLADLLDSRNGSLGWETLRPIVVDTLRGLAYLHAKNPVALHRDIKPDNILNFGGRWALGDLGLATPDSATRHGAEAYRAPELRPGVAPSVATDLWALGHLIERVLGCAPTEESVGSLTTATLLHSLKHESAAQRPESAVLVLRDLAPTTLAVPTRALIHEPTVSSTVAVEDDVDHRRSILGGIASVLAYLVEAESLRHQAVDGWLAERQDDNSVANSLDALSTAFSKAADEHAKRRCREAVAAAVNGRSDPLLDRLPDLDLSLLFVAGDDDYVERFDRIAGEGAYEAEMRRIGATLRELAASEVDGDW